jgi:hypothetical protein
MSIPQPLLGMCRDTVTITPFDYVDTYGVNHYTTSPTTYTARIVGSHKIVKDRVGDDVVSAAKVTITEDIQVDMRSKITLSLVPGGCTATPEILSVEYYPYDVTGSLSHSVLYVGGKKVR